MNKERNPLGLNPSITIFKNLKNPNSENSVLSLTDVIERIQNGNSKELVQQVRLGFKESKNRLPCIMFQGEFSKRNSNSLKTHSGLMVLDFDKIVPEAFAEEQQKINNNQHVLTSFRSPSGDGIKAIVRVPNDLNKETHPKYYKAFTEEFKSEYLDSSGSDLARICFESYDPDIFVNNKAKIYTPKLKELNLTTIKTPLPDVTISASENDTIQGIMKFNFKTSFFNGQKNQHVFNIAGAMCEYGVTQASGESYIMENIVNGNCKDPQAKLKTIRSAYNSREFGSKTYEDLKKKSAVIKQITKGVNLEEIAKDNNISVKDVAKIEKEENLFWYIEKNKVKIVKHKFGAFLKENGFYKYYATETKTPSIVHIKNNIIEESSSSKIKDFVTDYLKDNLVVLESVLGYPYLTSETFFMLTLDTIEVQTLRDTKEKAFIPYQNGILEITKDSKKLVKHSDTNFYIWREQILKRNYVEHENDSNDYKTFVSNVSNGNPQALESVLGYLISTYKNRSNNKAIIFNDEVISDVSNGGTGKGLIMQGIKEIRNTAYIDGKSFDDRKTFKYQMVNRDTQVLMFDDVKKNFNLENKFSIITEGIEVERKNKDAIRLPAEESPKIVITTNYVIQGDGNSHHRRVHEVEINQYYGKHLTPEDEFNRQLFQDWNSDDFEKFDNYMAYCLQKYLIHGLIEEKPKNLKLRKLIAATNKDFVDFMEEGNIVIGDKIQTELAFNNFKDECKDFDNKHFSRKRFTIWIKKYCDYKGLEFNSLKSGSVRYIYIINTEQKEQGSINLEDIPF